MNKIKVDCHIHSRRSFDGYSSPEQMVRRMSELGIGAACITDHNAIDAALEIRDMNPPFQTLIGEEIESSDGEAIGIFLQERIKPFKSLSWTLDAIHEQGGVAIIPHPFVRVVMNRIDPVALYENLDKVDAIEVINSRNENVADELDALEFARKHGKPVTAGSDSHLDWTLGRAYVLMDSFDGPEEFLQNLAVGTIVCEKRTPLWLSGITFGFKFAQFLPKLVVEQLGLAEENFKE